MLPYNNIRDIRQLVSHTKEEFAEVYIKTLENFQKVVDQKQFERAMILAVNALKVRRAYMLPIWTDAETCYEQKEVWTYAVLIKCLLTVIPVDSKVTLTHLMSPITYKWFKRFAIIEETLNSTDENSVLNEII